MKKSNVIELEGRAADADPLTEMLRVGARRLIEQAVETELQELLMAHEGRRLADGRAGVVRNGHLTERDIQTGLGPATVRIPKVRAKTGEPVTFRSALVPPYVRKTRSLESALPWLYLKVVSTGEMSAALEVLVGPEAKQALHEIWQAETREDAGKAFDLFLVTYEPKYPKAALCLEKDREELMAFYDFPAQHWQSIRTSNPIESTFATIRHRTKRSKGCLSRDGMLHMMFKLGQYAQKNWRRQRGFEYLAQVITGAKFRDGIEVTASNRAAA